MDTTQQKLDWNDIAKQLGGETWHTGGGCMSVNVPLAGGGFLYFGADGGLPETFSREDQYAADVHDADENFVGAILFASPHSMDEMIATIKALAASK